MKLRLKEWRERRMLTQKEVAERAGLTETTVNRIEQGKHEPRVTTVRRLAAALGVSGDELIVGGNDDRDVAR